MGFHHQPEMETNMAYDKRIPDEDSCDIMTVSDFMSEVNNNGLFNDNDGVGFPAKDNQLDYDVEIYPSRMDLIPDDATHIVWFNK
jgi:hypothetical protein